MTSINPEEEYIGKICGSFLIIGFVGRNKYKARLWLARCKCGRERNFTSSFLSGNGKRHATQCMICTKRNGILANQTQDAIPHRFWKRLCDQAIRRGIEVTLSQEEAFALFLVQNKKCALTNEDLYFTLFRTNFNRYTNASLDRIDSSKPYSLDNVQWVHKKVNMMKGTLKQDEFLKWCSAVHRKSTIDG